MFGPHQTLPAVLPAMTIWTQTSLNFYILMPQQNASETALGALIRPWGQWNTHSKWLSSHFTDERMGADFKQDLSYWKKGYLKAAETHVHLAFPSAGVLPKWGGIGWTREKPSWMTCSEPNTQSLKLWSSISVRDSALESERTLSSYKVKGINRVQHFQNGGEIGGCFFKNLLSFSGASLTFLCLPQCIFLSENTMKILKDGGTEWWWFTKLSKYVSWLLNYGHFKKLFALLKVLAQNRQDVASKQHFQNWKNAVLTALSLWTQWAVFYS